MIVLGIDPGQTTGWCVYDSEARTVLAAGEFDGYEADCNSGHRIDAVVLERPKGQGPTRPELVDAGVVFGYLLRWAEQKWPNVHWLYRYTVKSLLRVATLGEVSPVNDGMVWAAVKLLHGGDDADRKATKKNPEAGPLAGCRVNGKASNHARAALALVVAWLHEQEAAKC